jgi:hypothetical protein
VVPLFGIDGVCIGTDGDAPRDLFSEGSAMW